MSNRDSNQSKGWRTTQNCSVKTPKCQTLKKIIASDFAHFQVEQKVFCCETNSWHSARLYRDVLQVIRNMGYTFTPITCHLILCMYTETPPSCRDVVLRWKGREKRPGSPGTAYVWWRLCFLLSRSSLYASHCLHFTNWNKILIIVVSFV